MVTPSPCNKAIFAMDYEKPNMILKLSSLLITMLFLDCINAQIVSPGIGRTNLASWYAIGFRQKFDSIGKKESLLYAGYGRSSTPNDFNLVRRSAIFTIDGEYFHRFSEHWKYSVSLYYQNQWMYESMSPYKANTPLSIQEFRLYGRIYYLYEFKRLEVSILAREEFRSFFTPNFRTINNNIQLRTRFRGQLKVYISKDKNHRIELNAEPFFVIQHELKGNKWSSPTYTESQFSLYYSFTMKQVPFTISVGYMNYITGKKKPTSTQYVGVDLVWNSPFRKHEK